MSSTPENPEPVPDGNVRTIDEDDAAAQPEGTSEQSPGEAGAGGLEESERPIIIP